MAINLFCININATAAGLVAEIMFASVVFFFFLVFFYVRLFKA